MLFTDVFILVTLLVRAYTTYVRPLVDYNSIIWSPHYKQDIERIESVQCRFTERLPGLKNYKYTERLTMLDLASLELRRLWFDVLVLQTSIRTCGCS